MQDARLRTLRERISQIQEEEEEEEDSDMPPTQTFPPVPAVVDLTSPEGSNQGVAEDL